MSYVSTILCSYMKYTIFLIYVDIFDSKKKKKKYNDPGRML